MFKGVLEKRCCPRGQRQAAGMALRAACSEISNIRHTHTAARDGRHGCGGRVRVYSRTYGLATAARDERQGRVCSRAYGLATVARDGRYNTRAVGRENEHGRAGGRASKQSVGWAAAETAGRPPAAAGRPPATAGDQSVVCERENGDYILYKKKIKKRGKENKASGRVYEQG